MSLVSGPGRGGANNTTQEDLELYIDNHVQYIKTLDSVRLHGPSMIISLLDTHMLIAERRV